VLPAAVVLRSTFRLHTHARAHAHTQAPTKPRFQKFHKFILDLPGTPCNPAGGRIIRRVMTSPPLVPFFSFFLPPPTPHPPLFCRSWFSLPRGLCVPSPRAEDRFLKSRSVPGPWTIRKRLFGLPSRHRCQRNTLYLC